MTKKVSRNFLKYIAVVAMLLDHIAWGLLDFSSPVSQLFHTLGRLTAPIMCYFLAEGYYYTKSKKKYAVRLAVFAVITQPVWCFFHQTSIFTPDFNMFFTLLLALGAIHVEAAVKNDFKKFILLALICCVSLFSDWYVFSILWCVIFYRFREANQRKWIGFSIVGASYFIYNFVAVMGRTDNDISRSILSSLYTLGVFMAIPLLISYNGEKGGTGKFNKWFFYVFYPLHLLIIGIIKYQIK